MPGRDGSAAKRATGLAGHRALRAAIERIDAALDSSRLWPLVTAFAQDKGCEYIAVLDAAKLSTDPQQATIHTNLSSEQLRSILEPPSVRSIADAFQNAEPLTFKSDDAPINVPGGKALIVPILGLDGAPAAGVIYAGSRTDVSLSTQAELQVIAHAAYDRYLTAGEKVRTTNVTLSPREIDCIRLAALGKSDREIGQALNISTSTVRFHMDGAKGKLGVKSRVSAVVVAMREKFIGIAAGVLSAASALADAEFAVAAVIHF